MIGNDSSPSTSSLTNTGCTSGQLLSLSHPSPRGGGARRRPSGSSKVENATTLIWKLLQVAESTFRWLSGAELLPPVYAGVQCKDRVSRPTRTQQQIAA